MARRRSWTEREQGRRARTRSASGRAATYRGEAMSSQSAAPAAPSVSDLAGQLSEVSLEDAQRIGRRLDGARKLRDPGPPDATLQRIDADIANARLATIERQVAVPVVRYPPE